MLGAAAGSAGGGAAATGCSGRRAHSGACSGSGPIAIARAGMPCSTGNRRSSRIANGSDAVGASPTAS